MIGKYVDVCWIKTTCENLFSGKKHTETPVHYLSAPTRLSLSDVASDLILLEQGANTMTVAFILCWECPEIA